MKTDVRFKLNGVEVGIDTTATNINYEYQYQSNIPIANAGISTVEVEDISPHPITVRSTASVQFQVKLLVPKITLSQANTSLQPSVTVVTATITNRPPNSAVQFSMDGNILKLDSVSPYK
ncbi:hypothetical protein QUA56_16310 [Microcoleus sp. N3A4]|uniref:hypothetical protein n=1 Tax=Microcoleus sp. N3A4 TaxID=3055379 RepID=UPI002FD45F1F